MNEVRNLEVIATNFAFSFPTKMMKFILENVEQGQSIKNYNTLGGRLDIEQRRLKAILSVRPAPGVISIAVRPDPSIVVQYREAGISLVLIDEEEEGASTVAVDNYKGGCIAAKCFLESGKKIPAIVCGRTEVKGGANAAQRLRGFEETLAANGVQLTLIREVIDYSYHDGIEALKCLASETPSPDFIFSAAGDDCAIGILRASADLGIKVPKDVSLIGFDDIESARMATPPLTTIRQPLREIASAAHKIASAPGDKYIVTPQKIIMEPELVIRKSV